MARFLRGVLAVAAAAGGAAAARELLRRGNTRVLRVRP